MPARDFFKYIDNAFVAMIAGNETSTNHWLRLSELALIASTDKNPDLLSATSMVWEHTLGRGPGGDQSRTRPMVNSA